MSRFWQIRYATVVCFAIFISKIASASDLRDAINSATANNRNIKLEKIRLDLVKTEKIRAIAEFLPNVSADANYGQRNSYYRGQTFDRSTKQKTREIKLEQPIFDGLHSVSKYQEANYKIKSGDAKTADKIQEVSLAAVQSYCNLYRYQELTKLHDENQKLGKKFLALVNRRKEVRIIDRADIIKFTYEVSLTHEKYIDSLNRLGRAKFEYQNVVGELHENLTHPKILQEEFNKEEILEAALENNNSIKSYHYNFLASKAAYSAEKSNFLPKLSVAAAASRQDNVVYLNNQNLNSRSVSLNLSVPIFQKGIEYANVSKARYESDVAREEYEINRENIIKEVNQTLEEYRFYSELNKTNMKLLELAKDRVAIFTKRTSSKVEDPIELIRAKIELNDRKINLTESSMDLIITQFKLRYFLGDISSKI